MSNNNEQDKTQIAIYIRGGVCIEVKTNLPDDTWKYEIVDYDNNPDLPDNYFPFDNE